MEFRIVRVPGWEFQIQVLPVVKVLAARPTTVHVPALPQAAAENLAFHKLFDSKD